MSISKTIARPKATPTLDSVFAVVGAIAEVSGKFAVDLYGTVTKDDTTTASKVIARVLISLDALDNVKLQVGTQVYTFPGTATNYSSGGTTPPLSAGSNATNVIDLDAFLTAAGDGRADS